VVGKDDVGGIEIDLMDEIVLRLDSFRVEAKAAAGELVIDELHIGADVFQDENSKALVHDSRSFWAGLRREPAVFRQECLREFVIGLMEGRRRDAGLLAFDGDMIGPDEPGGQ
jgi:hypothetical protein